MKSTNVEKVDAAMEELLALAIKWGLNHDEYVAVYNVMVAAANRK